MQGGQPPNSQRAPDSDGAGPGPSSIAAAQAAAGASRSNGWTKRGSIKSFLFQVKGVLNDPLDLCTPEKEKQRSSGGADGSNNTADAVAQDAAGGGEARAGSGEATAPSSSLRRSPRLVSKDKGMLQ